MTKSAYTKLKQASRCYEFCKPTLDVYDQFLEQWEPLCFQNDILRCRPAQPGLSYKLFAETERLFE
jgi:hypothetical protein